MEKAESASLKRELGLPAAASIVVGTVIGSGIFLVPKDMIQHVGSPWMVFLVWVAGGLLSLFGALSYAELAAAMPEAGGEYVFLREAYGPFWGYVYGWTQIWVAKSGSIAAIASGFFLYLGNFIPGLEKPFYTLPLPLGPGGGPLKFAYGQLSAMALILSLALVNYLGVKAGGRVQVVMTVSKLGLIFAIIFIGLGAGQGTVANFGSYIQTTGGLAGFFAAMVGALWAYDGWNNVSMVSSEIRKPQRNLPIALIAGTLVVMGVYLLANAAYFYVLKAGEVAASDRVAAEMMGRILGPHGAAAVSIAAMISIFAALNGSILSGARVPFAMARDGLFIRSFAQVHPEHRTPGVALLGLSAWGAVLVFSGRFEELFRYVIFSSWILYGMTAAAVLVLRYKKPDMARPYRTFGFPVVPVLFVAGAAAVLLNTLINFPRESIFGLFIIALSFPFYFRWKRRMPERL